MPYGFANRRPHALWHYAAAEMTVIIDRERNHKGKPANLALKSNAGGLQGAAARAGTQSWHLPHEGLVGALEVSGGFGVDVDGVEVDAGGLFLGEAFASLVDGVSDEGE